MKTKKITPLPKLSANVLTKQTLKVLDLLGFIVWRQNNGAVYDPTKKVFRRNSSTPGISDVIGLQKKTGLFIAAEIKVGKDKLSPYQQRFLEDVRKNGGYALVVRTYDDLIEFEKTFKEKFSISKQ